MVFVVSCTHCVAALAGIVAINLQWLVLQGQTATVHSTWGWSAVQCRSKNTQCQETGTSTFDAGTVCTPTCAGLAFLPSSLVQISCPSTSCLLSGSTAKCAAPDNGWWSICSSGSTCSGTKEVGASVTCNPVPGGSALFVGVGTTTTPTAATTATAGSTTNSNTTGSSGALMSTSAAIAFPLSAVLLSCLVLFVKY